MKKGLVYIGIVSAILLANTSIAQKGTSDTKAQAVINELAIGSPIPNADNVLHGAIATTKPNKPLTLNNIKTEKGLIVMFSCNTCPFVKKAEVHTKEIMAYSELQNVGMVLVNSNEATRKDGESEEDMIDFATHNNYTVPYIVDRGSILANAFGATHTPEVFLFDGEGKLVYKGAMEDNPSNPVESVHFYLKEATDAMLAKGIYQPQVTKSLGCTIKRK